MTSLPELAKQLVAVSVIGLAILAIVGLIFGANAAGFALLSAALTGLAILLATLPLAAIVLYAVWWSRNPEMSGAAAHGAARPQWSAAPEVSFPRVDQKPDEPLTDEELRRNIAEARALRTQGMSPEEISRTMGIREDTARWMLKKSRK